MDDESTELRRLLREQTERTEELEARVRHLEEGLRLTTTALRALDVDAATVQAPGDVGRVVLYDLEGAILVEVDATDVAATT